MTVMLAALSEGKDDHPDPALVRGRGSTVNGRDDASQSWSIGTVGADTRSERGYDGWVNEGSRCTSRPSCRCSLSLWLGIMSVGDRFCIFCYDQRVIVNCYDKLILISKGEI